MDYKFGIFYWFGFLLPLSQRLDLIKEAGFDAVSIWWEDESLFLRENKEEVPSLVRKRGLSLDSIHLPYEHCNSLWQEDKNAREDGVKAYSSLISASSSFGVPLVIHLTDGEKLPGPISIGFHSFSLLLQLAESLGVVLAVENTQCTSYLKDLFSTFDSQYLSLCYDSSHDHLVGERGSILEDLGSYIGVTHLSDNDGEMDRHWIPGDGILHWDRIASLMKTYGYQRFLSLEVLPGEEETSPQKFLTKANERVRWLAGMIN